MMADTLITLGAWDIQQRLREVQRRIQQEAQFFNAESFTRLHLILEQIKTNLDKEETINKIVNSSEKK